MRKPLVIGICGGSGSGKTAIANALFKYYKGTSLILNQDFYYKDLSSMSFTSRCKQNFDHPDSIDFKLLESIFFFSMRFQLEPNRNNHISGGLSLDLDTCTKKHAGTCQES